MERPQFTTRDLLLALAMISVGIACLAAVSRISDSLGFVEALPLWGASWAVMLVGLLAPFHRKRLGVFAAVVIAASGLLVLVIADALRNH